MKDKRKSATAFLVTLAVWGVISCDALSINIPMHIIALAIWSVGSLVVGQVIRKQNKIYSYYNNLPFDEKDYLILFFVITGGMAVAGTNFLYAGLKPLFIREMLSGHVLYTIRNVIYYPVEVLLMLELLMVSQKAGDFLTGKSTIPWGTFTLFLLWGLPHILWHGFTDGFVSAMRAFIYSIPFYASDKNIKTAYIGMLILWFL